MGEFRTGNVVKDPYGYMVIITNVGEDSVSWVSFNRSNSSGTSYREDKVIGTEECKCVSSFESQIYDNDGNCSVCKGSGEVESSIIGFNKSQFLADNVETYIKNRLLKNFEF